MRVVLQRHGEKIANGEARFESGDKRFEQLEGRVLVVETSEKKTGRGLAYLAGLLGAAGGAATAGLAKLFGH